MQECGDFRHGQKRCWFLLMVRTKWRVIGWRDVNVSVDSCRWK